MINGDAFREVESIKQLKARLQRSVGSGDIVGARL